MRIQSWIWTKDNRPDGLTIVQNNPFVSSCLNRHQVQRQWHRCRKGPHFSEKNNLVLFVQVSFITCVFKPFRRRAAKHYSTSVTVGSAKRKWYKWRKFHQQYFNPKYCRFCRYQKWSEYLIFINWTVTAFVISREITKGSRRRFYSKDLWQFFARATNSTWFFFP